MKNPPSASVSPPIHTTQRVPTVSSKPRSGCGNGGGGAVPLAVCSVASGDAAGAIDSTSGRMGGGSGVTPGVAGGRVCSNASSGVRGGGMGVAVAAAAPIASPNRLIVSLADKALGREGRMLRALDEMGPGSMTVEGRPFQLDLE